MAGSLSNYLENKLLNYVLRNEAYAAPTGVYVALFTAGPDEAGTGTEVKDGAYARQSVTFQVATAGTTSNSADVLFPVATADWGTVKALAVFDASTGGNMLFYGTLAVEKTITTSDQFKISAGNLTISLD